MNSIIKNFGKLNAVLFAAAITTLCLFYTMQALILSDLKIEDRLPPIRISDVSIPDIDTTPIIESIPPEKADPP